MSAFMYVVGKHVIFLVLKFTHFSNLIEKLKLYFCQTQGGIFKFKQVSLAITLPLLTDPCICTEDF